jgi:predicted RNase H-like nuclease (RuvC/YqgF family)
MGDKPICPHFNIGFCKFKEMCFKIHPKDDCTTKDCKRNGCNKRHRRMCKYLTDCIRLNKHNDCEFKHADKDTNTHKKLTEANSTINKFQTDVDALKRDILNLKEDNKKKALELEKLSSEINKNKQIVKIKDSEISRMKVNFEKSLQDRNDEIARLKKEVSNMAEEIMQHKLLKEMEPVAVKTPELSIVKCKQCDNISEVKAELKSHIASKHGIRWLA